MVDAIVDVILKAYRCQLFVPPVNVADEKVMTTVLDAVSLVDHMVRSIG